METLASLLPWIQIVLSVALIALILLQQNDSSLGDAFGGGDSATHAHRKRGVEKMIFNSTVIVAILFVLSTVISLLI